MSGRDMRTFITSHRSKSADILVQRVKDGIGSNKYKTVDYEKLKALAAEKKLTGTEKLLKVKKLQHASKQSQEQHTLKQHKGVWQKEFLHLNHSRKRLQAELDLHMKTNVEGGLLSQVYRDFEYYDFGLDRNFQDFKKNTVEPLWNFREDLNFWIEENKNLSKHRNDNIEMDDASTVKETLNGIKAQQNKVVEALTHEQQSLEEELRKVSLNIPDLNQNVVQEQMTDTGIPEAALDLECPDFDLKVTLLQEFILLDGKYVEKLTELEDQHASALRSTTGGWKEEDHFLFVWIMEQYPFDLQNRRTLYIDRLQRHLPYLTRHQIVQHEEWWLLYKYYHKRRRALITDWKRDRSELFNRVKLVMEEAVAAKLREEEKERQQELQRETCQALLAKVEMWRQQKMEALQLQEKLAAEQQKLVLEKQKEEDERENERRKKQKEKVHEYRSELESKKREAEEKDKQRLAELQSELAEQAARDRERVKFREEEYREKEAVKQRKREEKEFEKEERERILEAIRETVRPHVEADLLRVWKDTEAWKARHKEEPEPMLQRPLYEINSFTSKQITSDPRFKLEAKLREAGIHDNAYARKVMAQTQALVPPRRDMESTVFK